ncbi:hypothetical protein [Nocardia heshunensis]
MDLILAFTLVSLAVFVAGTVSRILGAIDRTAPRLTVDAIRDRLNAEGPQTYTPISRGW